MLKTKASEALAKQVARMQGDIRARMMIAVVVIVLRVVSTSQPPDLHYSQQRRIALMAADVFVLFVCL